MTPHDFWENKHRGYAREAWIREPTLFAAEVSARLKPGAAMLELGCGQGQDSTYFADQGVDVTAMDFSKFALEAFPPVKKGVPPSQVQWSIADIPYPFPDGRFDVVYAHLSLHYFDLPTTGSVFTEIHRLLRPGGLLAIMLNSVDDPEFGEGKQLEDDFYEVNDGDFKRYFSRRSLYEFTRELFVPFYLEQHGRTRKDPHTAFVRFVASKR